MDIYPRDLGDRRWANILRRRTRAHLLASSGYDPFEAVPERRPAKAKSFPGRGFWTRGLNLDEAQEAQVGAILTERHRGLSIVGSAATGITIGSILLLPIAALIAGSGGEAPIAFMAVAGWCGVATALLMNLPRSVLKRIDRSPITVEEIQALRLATSDRLERTYLSLVLEACSRNVPAPVQADIRDALKRLGEATASAPPALPARDRDPGKLLSDAHALRAQAQRESDPTISSSLNRQADTLERRSEVAGAADGPGARRRQVMREELRLQMETLRTSLIALETGVSSSAEATNLADSVQRVAAGTAAVTAARNELDDEEIAQLRGGVPTAPATTTQPEAKVSLQWWR